MATRNSTASARSGRNRTPSPRQTHASAKSPADRHSDTDNDDTSLSKSLHEAIENERTQLRMAESVLRCLSMALSAAEGEEIDDLPYFPYVADIAYQLVRASVDRLDSIYIDPLIRETERIAKAAEVAGIPAGQHA